MKTTKKTAGKTAKKELTTLSSFFEEETGWVMEGKPVKFSKEELKAVVECTVKAYEGQHGVFTKLYVRVEVNGKTLSLKGDNGRTGLKLDKTSDKNLGLEPNEERDIDPENIRFKILRNVETGETIKRAMVIE